MRPLRQIVLRPIVLEPIILGMIVLIERCWRKRRPAPSPTGWSGSPAAKDAKAALTGLTGTATGKRAERPGPSISEKN